jgi:hypothetical protein
VQDDELLTGREIHAGQKKVHTEILHWLHGLVLLPCDGHVKGTKCARVSLSTDAQKSKKDVGHYREDSQEWEGLVLFFRSCEKTASPNAARRGSLDSADSADRRSPAVGGTIRRPCHSVMTRTHLLGARLLTPPRCQTVGLQPSPFDHTQNRIIEHPTVGKPVTCGRKPPVFRLPHKSFPTRVLMQVVKLYFPK